jgi:hypothetical protein
VIKILGSEEEAAECNSGLNEISSEIKPKDGFKAWDYYNTIQLLNKQLSKEAYIINCGAMDDCSLAYLHLLGYKHLYGIDLSKDIYDMPYYTQIKYSYGNMLDTHFPESFFNAVVSISAIEYGGGMPQFRRFLEESKKILTDKGLLVVATDYSEKKIDVHANSGGLKRYIFSKEDIQQIIDYAHDLGFELLSEGAIPEQAGAPIKSRNCDFTFILLAFRLNKQESKKRLDGVNILNPCLEEKEGITEYSKALAFKFEQEGVMAKVINAESEINKDWPTVMEFGQGLAWPFSRNKDALIEIHGVYPNRNPITLFVKFFKDSMKQYKNTASPIKNVEGRHENESPQSGLIKKIAEQIKLYFHVVRVISRLKRYTLLIRDYEMAEYLGFKNYVLMPHIAYPYYDYKHIKPSGICIGAFGFAAESKNFDKVCELAKRLNIKAKLLLSIPGGPGSKHHNDIARKLSEEYQSDKISIKIGYFSNEDILHELSECTHIVSAQDDVRGSGSGTSGSLRFPVQLGIPIISTDNYQAREAQSYRVKSFDDITLDYLNKTHGAINLDDGFRYLLTYLNNR